MMNAKDNIIDTGIVLVDNPGTASNIEIGENVEIVSSSDVIVECDNELVNSTLGKMESVSYVVGDGEVVSLECVESFKDEAKEGDSIINGNGDFITEEVVSTSPIGGSEIFPLDNTKTVGIEDETEGAVNSVKHVVQKVGSKRSVIINRVEGVGGKQRKVSIGSTKSPSQVTGESSSSASSSSQPSTSAKGQPFKNTIQFKSVLKSATGLQEFQPLPKKYMIKKKVEGKVPISATPSTSIQARPPVIALPIGSPAITSKVPATEGNKMRFVRLVNGQVLTGPNVASLKPVDSSKGLSEEPGGGKFHPILPATTTTAKSIKFCPILPAPSTSQNSQPKTFILKSILPGASDKTSSTISHTQVISSSIPVASQPILSTRGASTLVPSDSSTRFDSIASSSGEQSVKSKENGLEECVNNEVEPKSNGLKSRKPCNCTRSQCLKLYCECFANGEFCYECNCVHCFNNLEHEENRQLAIKSCLERNPHAFRPKIGKCYVGEKERVHKRGCNCKRSGCLKNYCECYEAKIPCSENCKCSGCKNLEDSFEKERVRLEAITAARLSVEINDATLKARDISGIRQAYSSMTGDVIDATCQCLLAQAEDSKQRSEAAQQTQKQVIDEFGRCLKQIIDCITTLFYQPEPIVIPVPDEDEEQERVETLEEAPPLPPPPPQGEPPEGVQE